jgi:hypothetical protein
MAPTDAWVKQDQVALSTARHHCQQESKCLITFQKVEEGIYAAMCGKDNN